MPKYDLKKVMLDLEAVPLIDRAGRMCSFDQPVTVTVKGGEDIENVRHLLMDVKELTYHRSIKKALSADISIDHPKYGKMPDKDKRSDVLEKLVADTQVEFDLHFDIPTIMDSALVASPTTEYLRLRSFFENEALVEDKEG